MKNRYSLFKKGYWEAGVLLGLCSVNSFLRREGIYY